MNPFLGAYFYLLFLQTDEFKRRVAQEKKFWRWVKDNLNCWSNLALTFCAGVMLMSLLAVLIFVLYLCAWTVIENCPTLPLEIERFVRWLL